MLFTLGFFACFDAYLPKLVLLPSDGDYDGNGDGDGDGDCDCDCDCDCIGDGDGIIKILYW